MTINKNRKKEGAASDADAELLNKLFRTDFKEEPKNRLTACRSLKPVGDNATTLNTRS